MKIVAHRGIADQAPENTIPAFERAIELGADAVELDIQLTADKIPVVFHDFFLDRITSASGAVFEHTLAELKKVRFLQFDGEGAAIPAFQEVLDAVAGRIGMQIEIKGPEEEAPKLTGNILRKFKPVWDTMEIISFEPALLRAFQESCPGLSTGLLTPRSVKWIPPNIVAYHALHRVKLARAKAIHLHASQLSKEVVETLHRQGIDVHAWDVNDKPDGIKAVELGISTICTDKFLEMSQTIKDIKLERS